MMFMQSQMQRITDSIDHVFEYIITYANLWEMEEVPKNKKKRFSITVLGCE